MAHHVRSTFSVLEPEVGADGESPPPPPEAIEEDGEAVPLNG